MLQYGLLALPKTIHIDLEEFIGNSKFLPIFPDRALNTSKEMVENLNNVSEAIQNMAQNYKETESLSFGDDNGKQKNKQIFITELLDNLEQCKDNILYDDLANVDGEIVNEIFNLLIDKQEIERNDLLEIFANCNSYIVGFDDKKISGYLEESITQVLRIINSSYKISKSSFVWMKKIEEKEKNIKTQLDGVSKAIQGMAQNIENNIQEEEKFEKQKREIVTLLRQKEIEIQEISIKKENRILVDIYFENVGLVNNEKVEKILTQVLKEKIVVNQDLSVGNRISYFSDDKYVMTISSTGMVKSKSEESGDSILNIRLKDGNYLIAISDGMGSGSLAKQSSSNALKLLENMILSGFDKNTSIELINTSLINQSEETFATLDIAIVDLYKGNIEFIKSGACPTYIKNNKRVQLVRANSLPTGILEQAKLAVLDRDILDGDIMLMCSDGILDSNIEYKNKELWIKYLLEDIETTNTKKMADLILNEAIDNNFGVAKDDMSLIVCKFKAK